jgi:hypothetical protein
MTPTAVTLSPDPAVAGKPLAVTVPGTTSARPVASRVTVGASLSRPRAAPCPRLTRARD